MGVMEFSDAERHVLLKVLMMDLAALRMRARELDEDVLVFVLGAAIDEAKRCILLTQDRAGTTDRTTGSPRT